VEHYAELRPAWLRDHERGVDPGCVDGEALLQQIRVMVAVRLQCDAGRRVVPHPRRKRERGEIELARSAARRLEVVPERPGRAVGEVRVAVQRLPPTRRLPQAELAQQLDVGGRLEAFGD